MCPIRLQIAIWLF